jgi:hypothetical protein
MGSRSSLAVLVFLAAASPVTAQSVDPKPSQCSFRSATTCWTVWGYRPRPSRSARPERPMERQSRDTLPVFAGTTARSPVKQ